MKTLPRNLAGAGLTALLLAAAFALGNSVGAQAEDYRVDLAAVDFHYTNGAFWFFDRRQGDLWIYDEERRQPLWHLKITQLGAPLEQIALEALGEPPAAKTASPDR